MVKASQFPQRNDFQRTQITGCCKVLQQLKGEVQSSEARKYFRLYECHQGQVVEQPHTYPGPYEKNIKKILLYYLNVPNDNYNQ